MTLQEAIKEAETQIDVYENMILYNKDFEPQNDNSNYGRKIEFLKMAIEALEKQVHSCEDCKHADYIPSASMIYCLEHSRVMRCDNYCRDWSDEK